MTDKFREAPGASWTAARMSRVAAPLRDQVSNALRQAIVERELRPGLKSRFRRPADATLRSVPD